MHHHFFAIGLPHGMDFFWIFLGVVILFGADKIPKLARGLGKSLGEFKKAKEEFEKEVQASSTDTEKKIEDEKRVAASASATTSTDELTKKS